MSVDYYTRLERGNAGGVSDSVTHLHHPTVGNLTLSYESMDLTADTGLRLNAYTAEPGSPSADALNLLASWSATPHEQPTSRVTD
jgi:hypothetical protein